jgi:hypothetical protein
VYDPDSLGTPVWTSQKNVPKIKEVLGVNLEARLLLLVDTAKNLVAVDLESRGIRTQANGVESAVIVPNGSVYLVNAARRITRVDAGTPQPYRAPLPMAPAFQAGTLGDRYAAVLRTKPPTLLVLNPDRQVHAADVSDGEFATTYWGDLLAAAAGDKVMLYETGDPFAVRSVKVSAKARHVAFSPSGHRMYVATDDPGIEVFDRYSLEPLTGIQLPGPAVALRTDGSGRWMLARHPVADSAWVIDLATGKLAATVATDWADDLPTVAGAATLLLRQDGDLIATDLGRSNHPERGRLNAADDFWIVTTWLPRERLSQAAAAAESALVAQDSQLVADSQATAPPTTAKLYLQVSSSQNVEWSKELAKQLSAAGYPAQVLDPTTADEGYRVVVGPFPTREEAEEAGRKLGRPYFVLTNPKIAGAR